MVVEVKNNRHVIFSRFIITDLAELVMYLEHLSEQTKMRFGPHPFDAVSITGFYNSSVSNTGYIARENETGKIIAYAVIKIGYLDHDSDRLRSYGLTLNGHTDCTFAPSVADQWQNMGIGNHLLHYIISDLKMYNLARMILWGGVQATNEHAVKYYTRNGFTILGSFDYNGWNYDMLLELNSNRAQLPTV